MMPTSGFKKLMRMSKVTVSRQLETAVAENHDLSNGPKDFSARNELVRHTQDIDAHNNVPSTSSSSTSKVNYRPYIKVEPFTANQHDSMAVSHKRKLTLDQRKQITVKRSRVLNMAEFEGNISNNNPSCSNENSPVENASDLQFNPENIRTIRQQGSFNFLNQCSQSVEHQQQTPVVSEEYLRQNEQQRETPGSSTVTSSDQRSSSQTIQHHSSAAEALRTLILKSRIYEQVDKIPSSMVNNDHSHNQQYTTNQIDRTIKVNCIDQPACTQRLVNETTSLQNPTNEANYFRQHTEHLRRKQLPPHDKDALLDLFARLNRATTENNEIMSQTTPTQSIIKDIQPEGQNLLNQEIQPCQVYEQLHKEPHTSSINVQQYLQKNKINITKNTECSNHISSIPKNTSPIVQNAANAVHSPHQLSERLLEQRFKPQMVVRTTGGSPINLRSNHQNNTKNNTHDIHLPLALQHLSNLENQTSKKFKFSNRNNLTASSNNSQQHSILQNAPSQKFLSGESPASNYTEPVLLNPRNESNQSSHQKLIVRGVLLQDLSTGALFIRSSNNLNNYKEVVSIPPSNEFNLSLSMQNIPTSSNQPSNNDERSNCQPYATIFENIALQPPSLQDSGKRHTLNLENQTVNFSKHTKSQPFAYGNFSRQDPNLRTPTVNSPDLSLKNVSANTSSIAQSLHCSKCCKCSHRKQVSSHVQDLSGKGSRKTNVEKFTIDNGAKHGIFSEINIRNHNTLPTIQKSLNIRSIAYPREDQISSNQKVFGRISVNHNCTEKSIHSENIIANNQLALNNSTNEQCLPIYVDDSDEDISSKEISDKESNNENRDRNITTDGSLTSTQISLNEANQASNAKAYLLGKMVALLKKINSTTEIEKISSDVLKNNEILTKVTKKLNDQITSNTEKDINVNVTASTSKDNPEIKKKQTKKTDATLFSNINDDADNNGKKVHNRDDNDKNKNTNLNRKKHKAPKKKRGLKRSFVLPPEYNPKNSKWTLKHIKASPRLVELMPHSRVYVNSKRLANCKRVAIDCKTMGRMLLTEVFSMNALSVCSWTGAKAKAFGHDDSSVRPGLDKHARDVLLKFTEEYGAKSCWCVFDSRSVLNSIRSKLQEIRRKHGETVR